MLVSDCLAELSAFLVNARKEATSLKLDILQVGLALKPEALQFVDQALPPLNCLLRCRIN